MAERPPSLSNKMEKCPCVAPPQQHNEMEQFQLLQKGRDRTQQQDSALSCWRSAGQKFTNLTGTWCQEMITMLTKGEAKPGPALPQSIAAAPSLDLFEERVVSSSSQVPGFVRNMHQRLVSNGPPDDRLFMDILRLTDAHSTDVAVTLLRCAPSCDRGAATMWKTIASSGTTMEKVLPTLLCVLEDWPVRRMYTSDGDNKDVFALAATRVIWEILRLPWCPEPFMEYSPHLLVALLFQVFISTEQMSEEVDNFWRKCQEEHNLPTSMNRFAVQTVRALLHHLKCLDIVVAMERKGGWDTLLYADTHHYAMGLLAREMRRVSIPMCSCIALRLIRRLSREEPLWDLAAMAFLVEVLEFLNFKEWGDTILDIMARHLQSESKDRCRLALRGLVVLSKDHSMDNHLVQLLSIRLYKDVMESVVRKGKKRLKMLVSESLLPLFFHCHDENVRVAEASRETLLSVVKFLKRKDLKQLLKMEDPWSFGERVLAEDRSRAAEHLQRALPYLESPQESLREAAVRSIGIAGLLMKGQPEELQLICEALQALNTDDSPSNTNLIVQVMFDERATSLNSSSGSKQPGQYQIPCRRRAPGDQRPAGASDPADAGDT
ncbi:maestro heat-like repeat-containing protein family member 7 isoform 2-T3 [Acridotheres tristis]